MSEEHLEIGSPQDEGLKEMLDGSLDHQARPESVSPPTQGDALHVDKYESAWLRISTFVLVVFMLAIVSSAFVTGFQLPGAYQRIDPATLNDVGSPFAEPIVRELAPGKYEVYIRAQIWRFTPEDIRIPAGSQITFYVTSQDVQHGFKLVGSNINMMILPGQVSTLTARFEQPGVYNFVCHEFCGQLHHMMYGRLVVEASEQSENATQAALAND